MATTWLPIIRREDYEAFRGLLGNNLPDTYDEWSKLHDDQILQIARGGHTVRGVKVYPDEFAVWLTAHRQDRTLHGLRWVAEWKSETAHDDD